MKTSIITKLIIAGSIVIGSSAVAQAPTILVAYDGQDACNTAYGKIIANDISQVSKAPIIAESVSEISPDMVMQSKVIIVGSPVYNANVSPNVQTFLNKWNFNQPNIFKQKIGAAFATGGSAESGVSMVEMTLLKSMMIFGMSVIGSGDWHSPFGAYAVVPTYGCSGSGPFFAESYLEYAKELATRVAILAGS